MMFFFIHIIRQEKKAPAFEERPKNIVFFFKIKMWNEKDRTFAVDEESNHRYMDKVALMYI